MAWLLVVAAVADIMSCMEESKNSGNVSGIVKLYRRRIAKWTSEWVKRFSDGKNETGMA
jgi:hypothetical protein